MPDLVAIVRSIYDAFAIGDMPAILLTCRTIGRVR